MPPVIDLNALLVPKSAQQIVNDALAYMAAPPDPNLVSVTTANWRTGGPYKTLLARLGIEESLLYQIVAAFAGSAFLRYAAGRWLDWLGQDFFNEARQDAQFATATITMTVPLGVGPYGPLQVTAQTADGKQFTSTALVTIPAGPTTINIPMRAATAGAAYNVGVGAINQLVTPNILGLSVTNAAAATGGFDEEPDDRYRQRLGAKWGVLATGSPAAAYIYWSLTASQEVQKVRVYSDLKMGVFTPQYITLVLASLTGPVSGAAVTAVTNFITPKIPVGSKLAIENCVPLGVTVTGTVKAFPGFVTGAPAAIANSLQALQVRVPIGSYDQGPVPVAEVQDAVLYDPTQIYDVSLTAPGGPISLNYNQLLLLTNGTTVVAA